MLLRRSYAEGHDRYPEGGRVIAAIDQRSGSAVARPRWQLVHRTGPTLGTHTAERPTHRRQHRLGVRRTPRPRRRHDPRRPMDPRRPTRPDPRRSPRPGRPRRLQTRTWPNSPHTTRTADDRQDAPRRTGLRVTPTQPYWQIVHRSPAPQGCARRYAQAAVRAWRRAQCGSELGRPLYRPAPLTPVGVDDNRCSPITGG